MKKVITFILLLFIAANTFAQVLGISASKLATYDANLVPKYKLEVEPSFTYLYSHQWFNNHNHLLPFNVADDSSMIMRNFYMRFTLGLGKNLEVGTFINADMSSFSFGAKYRIFQHEKSGLVLLAGTTFSRESDLIYRSAGFYGKTLSLAGGFAFTQQFSPRLSWDTDLQYQNILSRNESITDNIFLDSEVGYYVYDHRLQVIAGLSFNYNNHKPDQHDTYRLTFNPGVTIETGKSYIIVVYFPVDLTGNEVERTYGFSLAFTLGVH